jgi:hypothetical protein
MEFSSFKPRQLLSASELLHSALDYITPTSDAKSTKPSISGFSPSSTPSLMSSKSPGGILKPQTVMQAAMDINVSMVHFYLGKGVEYVFEATADIAREQSSVGDGMIEDTFDHEEGEERVELGCRKLVRCANDLKSGSVRLGVGVGNADGVAGQ